MDCNACDAEGCDQRCSRCGVAYYCDADCSKAGWVVHKAECFDRTRPGAIQERIDALLDEIDVEDKEFAELGENLIATLDCAEFANDPEIIGMGLQWLNIGAGFWRGDPAKRARGLRAQRQGTPKRRIFKRMRLKKQQEREEGKAVLRRQKKTKKLFGRKK